MNFAPPNGTTYTLPATLRRRSDIVQKLTRLYTSWGYQQVDFPVLEHYDSTHPIAEQSFKLTDRDNDLLSLRSDFTTATARMVQVHYADFPHPLRLQYNGKLWQTVNPDIARTREFSQIGVELVGLSNAKADAELVYLAKESLREVGLTPRVEIGNPAFVATLFDLANIPSEDRTELADAIDRKAIQELQERLNRYTLAPDLYQALVQVIDLYGDTSTLEIASQRCPWPETQAIIERLKAIIAEFDDSSELLIDLGMARRQDYYTGFTFRAYTFDFGQPILGGGRYDGILLPEAAGFALGLERIMGAQSQVDDVFQTTIISTDDTKAAYLRRHGYSVERAVETDLGTLLERAKDRGIAFLVSKTGVEALSKVAKESQDLERLEQLLEQDLLEQE